MVWTLLSKDRGTFHDLLDFPGRNIFRNDRENTEYNRICSRATDAMIRNFVARLIILSIGGTTAEFGPAYVLIDQGVKTTTTKVKFPIIVENSDTKFLLNIILQFTIFIHRFLIYVGIEITMLIFGNVATVTPKLIGYDFRRSIDEYGRN